MSEAIRLAYLQGNTRNGCGMLRSLLKSKNGTNDDQGTQREGKRNVKPDEAHPSLATRTQRGSRRRRGHDRRAQTYAVNRARHAEHFIIAAPATPALLAFGAPAWATDIVAPATINEVAILIRMFFISFTFRCSSLLVVQIASFRSGSLLHAAICMVPMPKPRFQPRSRPSATLRP